MLLTKPDGVAVYRRSEVPEHLWTYEQLRLAGLRPARASRPDGAWPMKYRGGQVSWMWLYDRRQARPYVCTTKHRRGSRHAASA